MRLIDADKLADCKFAILETEHVDFRSYQIGFNDAIEAIMRNAPTVAVERTASWKLWSTTENGKREIWNRCTNCNWPRRGRTPYCPNCGAKMKEAT